MLIFSACFHIQPSTLVIAHSQMGDTLQQEEAVWGLSYAPGGSKIWQKRDKEKETWFKLKASVLPIFNSGHAHVLGSAVIKGNIFDFVPELKLVNLSWVGSHEFVYVRQTLFSTMSAVLVS